MFGRRGWLLSFASLVMVLALVSTACGDDDTTEPPGDEPSTEASSPSPAASDSPSPEPTETVTLEVWFTQDGDLFLSHRDVPKTQAVGRAAVEALLEGPDELEASVDVTSAVPEGTELLDLSISDGVATVDLTAEYEGGGGSAGMFARLAQVVYTLTQFPTVEGVTFRVNGDQVETFSGEGIVLDGPQTRKDFKDQLPAILVEAPTVGQEVSTPMLVAGTANVFEATVSIKLVGVDGKKLADTFTTATCGTGCRGDYREKVDFQVTEPTEAILEVYEASAEDGSAIHVERIPVTLVP